MVTDAHNIPVFHCRDGRLSCYQKHNNACESFAVSTTAAWRHSCALTIGNFDGVHRGHQAMLALLRSEARPAACPVAC
jgi:hypothetical protein